MAEVLINRTGPAGLTQADLLFAVDPAFDLVSQAVIAFDHPTDVAWPLEQLNQALATCYGAMLDGAGTSAPQIYPVRSRSSDDAGFIVAPRDDSLDRDGDLLWEAFWGMLEAGGNADTSDPDALRFTLATPFYAPGGFDGTDVGIVGYPRPYGPAFPHTVVNDAIWRLLRQPRWPLDFQQLFVYPIRSGESQFTAGLWLNPRVDNLDLDQVRDDIAMRTVRELNHSRKNQAAFPDFPPQRFDLS